jgi:small neutral amino acid transporter SnatA (MarC family)
MQYFFVVSGLFAFFSALANWEWFMAHPRAELFVKLFGRSGARIVYALIGLTLIAIGGAMILFPGATSAAE